ncbi:MAG TPA: DNA replication/repair protein RecF [Patescibacteria group bacterium]|nr:DNA replication/repair protein RecF [Patescibacteria group bacterium]
MITDIRLQHFRSYPEAAFELSPGVNIIVGPNASGKTNLLEALLVLARGNSYRGTINELVEFKKPWARLDAHTPNGTRSVKIESPGDTSKKSFEINGQTYTRLSLDKSVPVVLFEPQHLQLLTGRPDLRRDYLDDLLEQTIVDYSKMRRDYRRTLAQRNSLLKQGPAATNQLFAWNIRLSELGGQIATHRYDLIEVLNSQAQKLYQRLASSKAKVELSYQAAWPTDTYSSQLLKKLESSTQLDFARGFTAYGPHRDDLEVLLNAHPAQASASRGEIRTLLLTLKILEMRLLEEKRGQKPLLLLDDVFSELDGARRRALTDFLKDYQTFITTTDADVVIQHFTNVCNVIALGT